MGIEPTTFGTTVQRAYHCAIDHRHHTCRWVIRLNHPGLRKPKYPINYIEQLTGLSQIVTQPTRVTTNSSSLLDVILTTNPNNHVKTVVIPVSLSDHYMTYTVITSRPIQTKKPRTIIVRSYKKFVLEHFKRDLYEVMPPINDRIRNEKL